ncbi:hypothetical protein AB0B10_25920 [Micromonospora arborensis]|uniref:hypothetical protein n=1 Tax=Micromonospora arborensis TaxID=2116518 RepID=UPI0033DB95EE
MSSNNTAKRTAWPLRAIGALIRGLTRAIAWMIRLSLRYGWRYRQMLAPLYVSFWLAVAALLLHGSPNPWQPITAGAAVAALCLAAWIRRRKHLGRKFRRIRQVYAWSCLTVASVWALVLTTWTPPATWIAGLHAALTVAAAAPWVWDRRIRRAKPLPPQVVRWNEKLAAEGRRLAGTELTNVKQGEGNIEWEGVIRGEPGLFTTDTAIAAQKFIGSAYQAAGATIVVEPEADERLDTARIMKVSANKTFAKTDYGESWHGLYKGSVALTTYPDGTRGHLAVYVPKAGTRSSIWAGDSSSGKSKGLTTAMTQVTLTGVSVPWAGCPQGGQSFPAYAGRDGVADFIARNDEGCVAMLEAFRSAMFARNAVLGELEFKTSKGRLRAGVARYDPDILVMVDGRLVRLGEFMPILDVTIDEIPRVFGYDESAPKLVADIVKLVSKAGGRLNIGVQMPSMQELGNDDTIRQNVKGNVVAFRNSESVSKGMILNSWMPSPADIPVHPPGQPEEHTLGTCVLQSVAPNSSRATFSRTPSIPDEDDFEWAEKAVARRPALDEITAKGAGADYYEQWKVNAMKPKVVRPGFRLPNLVDGTTSAGAAPEPATGRERITVSVAPAAKGKKGGTIADRAVAFLESRDGKPATTSVIANAISEHRSATSQALGREASREDARVRRSEREGEWALAAAPQREMQEVAA